MKNLQEERRFVSLLSKYCDNLRKMGNENENSSGLLGLRVNNFLMIH